MGPMTASGELSDPSPAPARPAPGLVAIGNFDGVHLGHRHVLTRAAERAAEQGLTLKVLTFDPHPRQVITGETIFVLTRTARKIKLLNQLGLGLEVVVLPFTSQTALLSPQQFCKQVLQEQLSAQLVVVGQNFRFGKGRAGDLEALSRIGATLGMTATAESLHGDAQGTYSSTRVRDALAEGNLSEASAVLGRPHLIAGRVTLGDQRGRSLGFPTANLSGHQEVLPKDGVYAGFVYDLSAGGQFLGRGAFNIGARPTVGRPHAVEVHVLDFQGDLYGRELGIELVANVRDVKKFDDVSALCRQIALDIKATRDLLAACTPRAVAPGYG